MIMHELVNAHAICTFQPIDFVRFVAYSHDPWRYRTWPKRTQDYLSEGIKQERVVVRAQKQH